MRIQRLHVHNFKALADVEFILEGKSAVIFGINGTGKSSTLRAINLLYANIINQIVNRKELKQNYTLELEDIQYGKTDVEIIADIEINGKEIHYSRNMVRKSGKRGQNNDALKQIVKVFQDCYISDEKQNDIPVFVNYGTNRLVLDIPLRIRTHHDFDIYSAFEKAIENKIDFRTFFEWYRNQEDYENQCKIENGNLEYADSDLNAVRCAIMGMLDECTNLRVARKPRLEMKIDKKGISLNVSQMSDGEKCTMALFGDLARRLTLANPNKENPLLGEGVVLIDEIELHMHPSWQRKVLSALKNTFPNIQFIITTHSPIVLTEANEEYHVFYMEMEGMVAAPVDIGRLDGYDANWVLESFMHTKSQNPATEQLIHEISVDIQKKQYDEAEKKLAKLVALTNENHPDVISARMDILRRRRV